MWDDACRWVRARLPLMAGGELTGSDRRRTERHLIGCPVCRDHLDSLQDSMGVLRRLAEVGPPIEVPHLWPALARQIRETRRERPGRLPIGLPAWGRMGLAASLLVGAGGLAAWAWSQRRPEISVAATPPASPTPHVARATPTPPGKVQESPDVDLARSEGEPANHPAPRRHAPTPNPAPRPPAEPTR